MSDFEAQDDLLEREPQQPPREPLSHSELLYRHLCDQLLLEGQRAADILGKGGATDDPSLYIEVPTEHFGTAVISDAGVDESHWDYAPGVATTPPRHRGLLMDYSTILTISFPDMSKTMDDAEVWYHAARPVTLKRDSPIRTLYEVASGSTSVDREDAVFFTATRIEEEPETDPWLKEVAKGLAQPEE